MSKILIYGATGYTGKLCAQEMLRHGLEPLLAARSPKVQAIAERLGCRSAVFDLENEARLLENLSDIDLVVNLAGPFGATQQPLIKGCIAAKCHYLDIAGEVDEMQTAFRYADQAQQAGIMLMPGAGFGVVPTDIVANMAAQLLPDAVHLSLAYATEGGASRGTLHTVLQNINTAGVRRVDHTLVAAKPAEKTLEFTVAGKQFKAVYNPWRADLFTAGLSTHIANIETYTVFPGLIVQMMHGRWLWGRDLILNRLLRFLPEGPSEKQLQKGATYVLALTKNARGEERTVSLKGPEAYLFTVRCVVAISQKIGRGHYTAGFQTPAYFGPELLENIEDVAVYQNGP